MSDGLSAGVAYLDVLPKVGAGFASDLSKSLTAPIAAEGRKISQALSSSLSVGKVAAIAGFAAIADAAFKGMSAAVHSTEVFGEEVYTLKRGIGSTAEEASKLVVLGQHFGISVDKLSVSFGFFSKQLVNGGSGLKRYGISLDDANGNQKSFSQLLGEVADKFVALPTGIDKAAFAVNVFGRSGRNLIPILALGSKGIADVEAAAEKYGLVLSGSNLEAIHKYALAQNNLNLASTGLKVSIGTALIPILTKLDEVLTAGVVILNKVPGPVKAVVLGAIGLTAALTALGLVVGIVKGALGNLGINLSALIGRNVAAAATTETLTVAMSGEGAAAVLASRSLLGLDAATSVASLSTAALATAALGLGAAVVAEGVVIIGEIAKRNAATKSQTASLQSDIDTVRIYGATSVQGAAATADFTTQLGKMHLGTDAAGESIDSLKKRMADAAAATHTGAAAMGDVAAKTRAATNAFWANATAALADRDAMLSIEGGLLGVLDAARAFSQANQADAAAQRAVNEDIKKGLKGTQQYRDDLKALSDAKFADVAANFSLKQSIAAYGDQLLGPVHQGQEAVKTAQHDLNVALADGNLKAKDAAQYNANVAAARAALRTATDGLTAAEKGLAPEQQKAISQLDDMFRKAGFTKGQIAALNGWILHYISTVKGVPNAKSTAFSAPGLDHALNAVTGLRNQIQLLHSKTITIQVNLSGDIYGLRYISGAMGVGSRGGIFHGYAGGALFGSPGGHMFVAGEGHYQVPGFERGTELASNKGVMPITDEVYAKMGAGFWNAMPKGGLGRGATAEELWPMIRELSRRPIVVQIGRREIARAVADEEAWTR